LTVYATYFIYPVGTLGVFNTDVLYEGF